MKLFRRNAFFASALLACILLSGCGSSASSSDQSSNSFFGNKESSVSSEASSSDSVPESSVSDSSVTSEVSVESQAESSAEASAESSAESSQNSTAQDESSQQTPSSSVSLKDFFTDEQKEALEKQNSTDQYTLKLDIVDNNKIIYNVTLSSQISDDDLDDFKAGLVESLDDSSFSAIIDAIETGSGLRGIVLSVRYLNADGSVIWEKEYVNTNPSSSASVSDAKLPDVKPGEFKDLQEFYNDSRVRTFFDSLCQSYSNNLMDVSVKVEDKSFIIVYTYKMDVVSGNSEQEIKTTLEANKDTYNSLLVYLRAVTNDDSVKFIMRYLNVDGSLVTEVVYD